MPPDIVQALAVGVDEGFDLFECHRSLMIPNGSRAGDKAERPRDGSGRSVEPSCGAAI